MAKQSKQNNATSREQYTNEIKLMKNISHGNIATFLGASYFKPTPQSDGVITIFYERLEPSEPIILTSKGAKASPLQRLKYVHQVAQGLSYLAGMHIYHGDIKLGNILYDRKGDKFKLCDWGFAKDLKSNPVGPAKGTPLHVAPELWKVLLANRGTNATVEYNSAIDVYAFGILAYTMLTGIKLSPKMNIGQLATAVVEGKWRPDISQLKCFPAIVIQMLAACWNGEPKQRPSFKTIVDTFPQIYLYFMFGDRDNNKFAMIWFKREFMDTPLTLVPDYFSIPWDYFLQKFCINYLGLREPLHQTENSYKIVEFLLRDKEHVDASVFANFIKFCGEMKRNKSKFPTEDSENADTAHLPYLSNGDQWLKRVVEDFLIPGWYGHLEKEETLRLLKSAAVGEYVLRYSSVPGSWVVSVSTSGGCVHVKIDHAPCTDVYVVKSGQKPLQFNTLKNAFEYVKKNLRLSSPAIIRPPNERIFLDDKGDINYLAVGDLEISKKK